MFLPLLRPGGLVVGVTSRLGETWPEAMGGWLRAASSTAELDALAEEFVESARRSRDA